MEHWNYAREIAEDAYSSNQLASLSERDKLARGIVEAIERRPDLWERVDGGGDCAYSPADPEAAEALNVLAREISGLEV